MRRLTFLVLVLAALYSGYWFVGARTVSQTTTQTVADARAAGWQVDYASLDTVGFPSRFDTTVTGLTLSPPDRAWSWSLPFAQVFALSYQPNSLIAALAPDQQITSGGETWQITADQPRASALVGAGTDLALQTLTAETGAVAVTAGLGGWSAGLARGLAAVRHVAGSSADYDVYVDASGLRLPPAALAGFDAGGALAEVVDQITLDSTVTLDQPLDRHAQRPALRGLQIKQFALDWGDLAVQADGTLEIGTDGIPTGEIELRTAQWREILDLALRAGLIQQGAATLAGNAAASMAAADGTLTLPLGFRSGSVFIGPFPVGPAPRFN